MATGLIVQYVYKVSTSPISETGFKKWGSQYLVNALKESASPISETGFKKWGSQYLVNALKKVGFQIELL